MTHWHLDINPHGRRGTFPTWTDAALAKQRAESLADMPGHVLTIAISNACDCEDGNAALAAGSTEFIGKEAQEVR